MSIFSKIRGAKKAADKHKDTKAQSSGTEQPDKPVVPYRHVPTHAAIDALSGAPSSWKAQDKSAIKAQYNRRSALSRNSSSLSTVMMQPSNSYQGSEWTSNRLETRRSHYGYQGYQNHQPDAGIGRSPLASNEISPLNSSKNSTASTDPSSRTEGLEIPARQQAVRHPEHNIFENLHKNTTRKVGEAPLYDVAPSRVKNDTPVKASEPVSPAPAKRKAWAFGKKSTAIAAH